MKPLLIGGAVGAIGGTLIGFAVAIFIYPFWFLQSTAMERLDGAAARTEVAHGSFTHINLSDPVHWGRGDVSVYREAGDNRVVFLHDTFEVGPGPRFHVYLVDRANIQSKAEFLASRHIDLGRLHAFKGSQIYPVPHDLALSKFESVVIWCKEFGVLISPATLKRAISVQDLIQDKGSMERRNPGLAGTTH